MVELFGFKEQVVVALNSKLGQGSGAQSPDRSIGRWSGPAFAERTDPNALVMGPMGVAFDGETGILYVADSLDNRIAAIPNALFQGSSANTGFTRRRGALNDPLGLALTPNHHLVAANGDDASNAFNLLN